MFIANLAWHREGFGKGEWHRFGKLWYDIAEHRAAILLHGFHAGAFVGKAYPSVPHAPDYLEGDIVVDVGEWEQEGALKKEYLWCGHIQTSEDERGVIYTGELLVDPTIALLTKKTGRSGGFLQVHLSDHGKQGMSSEDVPF
jgi:hypothetical protein